MVCPSAIPDMAAVLEPGVQTAAAISAARLAPDISRMTSHDTGSPGGVKPLAPLVHRGIEQAKPQRPEAGAPRPIVRLGPKSPEPEKIHQAISQNVAGFPHIEIDHFKLGRFQVHKPGKKPFEYAQGIFPRTQISRQAQHCQAPKERGQPIIQKIGFPPKWWCATQRFDPFTPGGVGRMPRRHL